MSQKSVKLMMKVLSGAQAEVPPIWMMRQAGRYLPEYRKVREKTESFLNLCYTPKLAAEVTMQPIKRFELDAAIIFSDILVIPDAIGRKVRFEEGIGPILEPMNISHIKELEQSLDVEQAMEYLSPVFEALELVKEQLLDSHSLLGFCGAPWTLACYMIAGRSSPDQNATRDFALAEPEMFQSLMDTLTQVCVPYLLKQLDAGADAVQIFDSWAFVLDEEQFNKWCVAPVLKIVEGVRAVKPDAKIIGFPRGVGALYENYREQTKVDVVGLDWTVPMSLAQKIQEEGPVQGNLDPRRLAMGGKSLEQGIENIMMNLSNGPLVFNLGHGILPHTPIENVEKMIKQVKGN